MSVFSRTAALLALLALAVAVGCTAFAGTSSGAGDEQKQNDGGNGEGGGAVAVGDASVGGDAASTADADGGPAPAMYPYEILTDGGCDLGMPFQTPVLVDGLGPGAYDTLAGFLSNDYQTLYFGRGNGTNDSLHVAKRSAGEFSFGSVAPITELNSKTFDSAPNLTANGLAIFFESERPTDAGLGRNIWSASRATTSSPFGAPVFQDGLNSDAIDEQPYLSPTGTTVYFASNRAGSAAMDIWWTTSGGNNYLLPSQVTEVNSASNDFHPVVSADLSAMYFASDRPNGAGDYDIYVTTRMGGVVQFELPTPVTELNTSYKDEPTWISPDGCTMLLASNRPLNGNSANVNIYVTSKPRM